ncbi:MAG: YeeE/YedE family protein [Allorhizobium sp.]
MNLIAISEWFGESTTMALGGLLVGMLFGAMAQKSRFCLRSAAIEFGHGKFGSKVAVWVLVFSTAVAATQAAVLTGLLDVGQVRQLATTGSISGAIIGGLLFGVGMILARGCASRLLVLSATGNLRALMAGLILTIVAQASLRGGLAPAREYLSSLWMVEGGEARNLLAVGHVGVEVGVLLGLVWLSVGLWLAYRNGVPKAIGLSAIGVGAAVALGWIFTYQMSLIAFDPVEIKSVSFTGPSADTLMGLISSRSLPIGFDVGLVPGVFVGSFFASVIAGEFKLQSFDAATGTLRYIIGACLMGFGGMLAGGCAVGAGVTGAAVFAVTAWFALTSMWAAAIITDHALDRFHWFEAQPADAVRLQN